MGGTKLRGNAKLGRNEGAHRDDTRKLWLCKPFARGRKVMNHPGSSKASGRPAAVPLLQHLAAKNCCQLLHLAGDRQLLTLNHLHIFCHSGRCHHCATATKPEPHSQATTRLLHRGLDAKCRLQINLEADTARLPWKPHKKPAVVWMS